MSRSRKTIGVQITNLHDEYAKLIWEGIVRKAEQEDVNILLFPGESPKVPYGYGYQFNVIYDLLKSKKLDALIIATGTLCNFISAEEFKLQIESLTTIPLISLSISLDGIPSLLVDNTQGIKEAVEHLLHVHKRKKIAFISGPGGNEEASLRLQTFISTMEKNGIPIDEELIYGGDFSEYSGKDAIKEFLDERKVQFDALLASNDNMAIGAMTELQLRGYRIPDDIAIIGFDNIVECKNVFPSLSTIKAPIYHQSQLALQYALELTEHKEVPLETQLPTQLLTRHSCGCSGSNIMNTTNSHPEVAHKLLNFKNEELLKDIKDIVDSCEFLTIKADEAYSRIQGMLIILEEVLHDEKLNTDKLITYLSDSLSLELKENNNIQYWEDCLNLIISFWNQNSTVEEYSCRVRTIMYQMKLFIVDFINTKETSDRIRGEKTEYQMNIISNNLSSGTTSHSLFKKVPQELEIFDINSLFIYSYPKSKIHNNCDKWVMPRKVRLELAYNKKRNIKIVKPENITLSPLDLIHDEYVDTSKRFTYIFMTFHFMNEQYGYICMELGDHNGNIYDFMRNQISSSYRGTVLLSKRLQAEESLRKILFELEQSNKELFSLSETDELTGLYNRRGFIKLSTKARHNAALRHVNGVLFFIDLDGLKIINDNLGHEMGDEAIIATSQCLQKVFRDSDIIARLGGDEFVIFTTNTKAGFEDVVRRRIREQEELFNTKKNCPFTLSMSIGSCAFSWDQDIDLETLMKEADKNLYINKKAKKEKRTSS